MRNKFKPSSSTIKNEDFKKFLAEAIEVKDYSELYKIGPFVDNSNPKSGNVISFSLVLIARFQENTPYERKMKKKAMEVLISLLLKNQREIIADAVNINTINPSFRKIHGFDT